MLALLDCETTHPFVDHSLSVTFQNAQTGLTRRIGHEYVIKYEIELSSHI